jgi:hypothetical protein
MSGEVYPDYDLLPPEQVPLDAPTLYELFLWDYLSNAYAKWYEGSEECPEEDRQLEDNFRAGSLPFFAERLWPWQAFDRALTHPAAPLFCDRQNASFSRSTKRWRPTSS